MMYVLKTIQFQIRNCFKDNWFVHYHKHLDEVNMSNQTFYEIFFVFFISVRGRVTQLCAEM